ncbi:MAG: hypothetical protein OXB98_16405 [Bryobacterales bacterium]|nr:hypothetical protein [Bryobacterales bacterium]
MDAVIIITAAGYKTGIQPETPYGSQRENINAASGASPKSVQFSIAIEMFSGPPAFAGRATVSRDQRFFTNHESRDTKHGFLIPLGTEALQSFFPAAARLA